jgi:hypothetical protein
MACRLNVNVPRPPCVETCDGRAAPRSQPYRVEALSQHLHLHLPPLLQDSQAGGAAYSIICLLDFRSK